MVASSVLLVSVALALPPAVCPPGLYPAQDGRCSGTETPWRVDEMGAGHFFVLPGGAVAIVDAGVRRGEVYVPAQTHRIDPADGTVRRLSAPFSESWADQVLQLPDGRVVALRGAAPDGMGAVGVRWLEDDRWREGPEAPPQSLVGAARLVEADSDVLFVGGGGPGTSTKKTAWRWSPATDRWARLPALPVGRGWARLTPGPKGPVVCGGVATVERDAQVVPGCLTLGRGGWTAYPSPVMLGPDADAVAVGGGVVVFDHGTTEQAWWVPANGTVTALPAPPAVQRWIAGAGPRLTGLDEDGSLCWLDPQTGAVERRPAPGEALGWTGAAIALDEERALYVGALAGQGFGAGVVDRGHPMVAAQESDMFTSAGASVRGVARLDDGQVSTWDRARRQFRDLPAMPEERSAAAIVPLADGRVLVAGGRAGDDAVLTAWTGDAAGWTPLAPLSVPLTDATGVLLADGTVVIAGARDRSAGASLRWDPRTGDWTPLPLPDPAPGRLLPLAGGAAWVRDQVYDQPRVSVAVLVDGAWRAVDPVPGVTTGVAVAGLADGSLVAAGGRTDNDYGGVAAAWRLAPGATAWTPLHALTRERWGGSLVELSPGHLLLVGGEAPAELYDGTSWVQAAPLQIERRDPHLYALDPTTALVLGGYTGEDGPDWEFYRVVGAATAFPSPALPDARLAGHPDAVGIGHRLVAADVACSAGDRDGCLAAALLWEAPPLSDPAKAAERRARACALGAREDCE